VSGRNASEREASSEKADVQAEPTAISGKAATAGEMSEEDASAARGTARRHVTRKASATPGRPPLLVRDDQPDDREDRLGAHGVGGEVVVPLKPGQRR